MGAHQFIAAIALGAIAVAGTASIASAADSPVPVVAADQSDYIDSLGAETPFAEAQPASPDGGLGGAMASVPSSNCYGQTDDPHKSGTDASVHGRSHCYYTASSLSVRTQLYRLDWWGWNSMATDYSSRTNAKDSEDAHPHSNCGYADWHLYRGYSSHVIYQSAIKWTAETWNDNGFSCR